MPRGGHFAALEEPELLAEDVAPSSGRSEEHDNDLAASAHHARRSSQHRSTRRSYRLIECGVVFRMLPDGSDFRLESARPRYDLGHLPGAVFVDPVRPELSDPASGLRFTMPPPAGSPRRSAALRVGPGTFTVARPPGPQPVRCAPLVDAAVDRVGLTPRC